jgi:DNA polymerase III epsilon subunit-like protein
MNFIALDFETANSNRSSICSVGLALVQKGKLKGTKHFYVKPAPNYYDGVNVEVHGITDKDTRNEKTFAELWQDLKPYFHNQTIVAHNAAFDFSALRAALSHSNLSFPQINYHCTYRLAQVSLNLPNHKLNTVSDLYKIQLKHHDAVSDARACALIAIKLCEKHKVNTLEELSVNCGYKVGQIISETKSYKPFSKKK